jgi:hypothetical protein
MKGIAAVWLEILFGIFIVGFIYIIFSDVIYGWVTPQIYPHLAAIDESSGVNVTMLHNTINLVNLSWYLFPLIMIFGLIFYGFIRAQKREYETGF